MLRFQSKRILYALIAGVVIGSSAFTMKNKSVLRECRTVTKLDRDVTKKRAYVQNMEKYKQRFQQLELELAEQKLSCQIPQMSRSYCRSLAIGLGMSVSALIALSRLKRPRIFTPKSFTMRLKGTYHEIATYIDSIGKMDRVVNVTGFECRTPPLRINV